MNDVSSIFFLVELFDGVKPQLIGGTIVPHPPKDNKKRLEHAWSATEDALLKSLVDKYPSNWTLVAESFNSARVTISIDRRTTWECFERWNLKFGSAMATGRLSGVGGHVDASSPAGVDGTPPPATPSSSQPVQMTTRGVKRLASINVTQNQAGGGLSSDMMKRRRHTLMYETIRKAGKRREAAQKAASGMFLFSFALFFLVFIWGVFLSCLIYSEPEETTKYPRHTRTV
jgi:chromatin modification-related protein VID21